jgi:hypothetical protein
MNAHTSLDIVARCFDAAAVNAIANHPAVLPGLSLGLDSLDATALVENPRNLCYIGEHGGAILVWCGPGIYDAHDFILPEGRGAWARKACLSILDKAFREHKAQLVWAQTPVENRACRLFNRLLGFTSRGVEEAILMPGTPPRLVEIFTMEAPCP